MSTRSSQQFVYIMFELILAVFAFIITSVHLSQRHCRYSSELDSQEYAQEDKLWTVENADRVIFCAARCLSDARCDGIVMNRTLRLCQGIGPTVEIRRKHRPPSIRLQAIMYTSMCKVSDRQLSKNCVFDSDCKTEGLICYRKKCQCRLKLLYSPSANACLKCHTAGSSFSWFYDTSIRRNYLRVLKDIDSTLQCQDRCMAETAFVCRSAGYMKSSILAFLNHHSARTCILSATTFGEVTPKDQTYGNFGWVLILRNCQ